LGAFPEAGPLPSRLASPFEEEIMMGQERLQGFAAEHLVEEGAAFLALGGLDARPATESVDVVVIGAGQAGLSVGYYLAKRGIRFVILDASERVGDTWRRRWDSLRLFTPARYDGLAGMPFPAPPTSFPTKDQMADYLEAYAAHFKLPVRNGMKVDRVGKRGDRYVVVAGRHEFEADHVVVAMANFQKRRVPAFAAELRPDIVQLHSSEYKNPAQLKGGAVLIAGAGNSGSEIAMELSRAHRVWMSGRDTGYVPFKINGLLARLLLWRIIFRIVFHRLLTIRTPMGRRARPKALAHGAPLIRVRPNDLLAAGVERVPRIAGVQDGLPLLDDGRVLDVKNVVWCTGFHPGFSWIDLPIEFEDNGAPRQWGGLVEGEPGLYFVGLHFLYAFSSVMIHGVGSDAARIVKTIATRMRRANA
jgi:putative flavoprotein involved in K+ transport